MGNAYVYIYLLSEKKNYKEKIFLICHTIRKPEMHAARRRIIITIRGYAVVVCVNKSRCNTITADIQIYDGFYLFPVDLNLTASCLLYCNL